MKKAMLIERLVMRQYDIKECVKMVEPMLPQSRLLEHLKMTDAVLDNIIANLRNNPVEE